MTNVHHLKFSKIYPKKPYALRPNNSTAVLRSQQKISKKKCYSIIAQLIILFSLSIAYRPALAAVLAKPLINLEQIFSAYYITDFRSKAGVPRCAWSGESVPVTFADYGQLAQQQVLANQFALNPDSINQTSSSSFPRYAISNNSDLKTVLDNNFFPKYCIELMSSNFIGSNVVVNIARSKNNNKYYWVLSLYERDSVVTTQFAKEFGHEFARGWILANQPATRIGKTYRANSAYRYAERYQSSPPSNNILFAKQLNPKFRSKTLAVNNINVKPLNSYSTITRLSTGLYRVTFPNFAIVTGITDTGKKIYSPAGVVHVTAIDGNHYCKVYEQRVSGQTVELGIACFTPEGTYTNGKFSVLTYKDGVKWDNRKKIKHYGMGYILANDLKTNKSYTATGTFQYNSRSYQFPYRSWDEDFDAANTVTRLTKGQYKVTLPNMQRDSLEADKGGTLLVTAYGYGALRCKAKQWQTIGSDVLAHVLCYNSDGELADSRFSLSYMREAGTLAIRNSRDKKEAFYVWGGIKPVQKHSFFQSDAYGNSSATSREIAKGVYEVQLPGVKAKKTSNVQVTAYGSNSSYCNVSRWKRSRSGDGTNIKVTCFDSNGSPIASNFALQYFTDSDLQ